MCVMMWFDLLFLQEVQEQFVQVQDSAQLQVPAEDETQDRSKFIYEQQVL